MGVKRLVGAFTISGQLDVPAGAWVDAHAATITQTASNTHIFSLGSGATLSGGRLVGRGTDYVAGGSPLAMGVTTSGTTGVRIIGVQIENVAGARSAP